MIDPMVDLYFSLNISPAKTKPTMYLPGAIIPKMNMRNVLRFRFVLYNTKESSGTARTELINVGNFLPYISPSLVTKMPIRVDPRENIVPSMAIR